MKVTGGIVFLSFIVLSILGFSSMAHESHAMHHSCFFNFTNTCAQVVDPIRSASEHLSSLQNSIQASLNNSSALAFILLAFSLVLAGLVLAKAKLKVARYTEEHRIQLSHNIFEFKDRLLSWLSTLSRRDPLVLLSAR